MHNCLVAFAALIVAKAAYLQLWRGGELAERASRQYFRTDTIPAIRGAILDSEGRTLVQSVARLQLAIAPREVTARDRDQIASALASLGVSRSVRQQALASSGKSWVTIPGAYMPEQLLAIRSLRGVYVEQIVSRASFASDGATALIGRVRGDGNADGGIEKAYDRYLRGSPGVAQLVRDPAGLREREVVRSVQRKPTDGGNVRLTINKELQGIAERALEEAVNAKSARSGDIVIVDPRSGEIRAMASYNPRSGFASAAAISDAYEPGSTLKPLLTSRVLELKRATPDELIATGDSYAVPYRREPIRDSKPDTAYTVREIIKFSSNIGTVKLAERLSSREQYETYRDFGLGMPVGVPLPGESGGRIYHPSSWSAVSKVQSAMGYEVSLTSLQLAMAYAAIANDGELLEPTLVREIRSHRGEVLFRHERRVVRRVMSPAVAVEMRAMLRDVVDGGTAQRAGVEFIPVAGKTGTARLSDGSGGYNNREHTATFAGMFPADAPQFVVVVRLAAPEGSYAASTAAPVIAEVLRSAAAAGDASLDRRQLIAYREAQLRGDSSSTSSVGAGEVVPAPAAASSDDGPSRGVELMPRVVELASGIPDAHSSGGKSVIPRVTGLPLRAAVGVLHEAGFRVRVQNPGGASVSGTTPPAGVSTSVGALVLLHSGQ